MLSHRFLAASSLCVLVLGTTAALTTSGYGSEPRAAHQNPAVSTASPSSADEEGECPPDPGAPQVGSSIGNVTAVISGIISETPGQCPNGICSGTYEILITNGTGTPLVVNPDSGGTFFAAPNGGQLRLNVSLSAECDTSAEPVVWNIRRRRGLETVFDTIVFPFACDLCPPCP